MSEYQYYDFRAIDRPLTAREMKELRGYSTRAVITTTRFTNHYDWGDFKGSPSTWVEKYFDAFLYVASWGAHQLMLRLPRRALDPTLAQPYLVGETASARVKGEHLILDFHSVVEDYDDSWDDDGSGWARIEELLEKSRAHGQVLTRDLLDTIVATSPKRRFAVCEDGLRIRASQGHSVEVDVAYEPATPALLFHGTVAAAPKAIRTDGLRKMERHHVNLSGDEATARAVGKRRGK